MCISLTNAIFSASLLRWIIYKKKGQSALRTDLSFCNMDEYPVLNI